MDKNKCKSCGEAPKECSCKNKDFTKAVVEINNPDDITTLLRKVVIPASMGTETDVPPAIGKYRNVLLNYEINNHSYLYSSDGIPTFLQTEVPAEITDRIDDLETATGTLSTDVENLQTETANIEDEIEHIKNNPDVVDVVATYADLLAYDTSDLGDNDVIRVLQDETRNNASTYYRWDKTNETWVFIGELGPYFTIFYRNNAETGTTNQHLYKDINFATAASAADIEAAANAGTVILMSIDQGSITDYWTFTLISIYKESGYYQFEFMERDYKWEYEAAVSTDTTFTRNATEIQNKMTAGNNISITGNIISATYTPFVGTDGVEDGAVGLVPAPESTDAGKYLSSNGSWESVVGPTVNNATISITNNGVVVDSFTTNESTNKTIDLSAPVITMTTTDPGEGASLAANNFIAVYEV